MSRIGIVALSHPGLGGTFQYTLSMIDALRRIPSHSYTIFTVTDNHFYDDLGVPIVRLPGALASLLTVLWSNLVPGRPAALFSEVDVVIAPIYTTRLLASRRPFVFTIHDLQERYYPENFTPAQRCWRSFSNTTLAKRADAILCESNHVKSDITKFLKVEASKIAVVAAPPVSAFSPTHTDASALERIAQQLRFPKQFIFYPAQFFPHKNHLRLIGAFAVLLERFPDCHLLLTGQKRYEYSKVMARAAELKIDNRVIHLGYVDTATLAAAYLRCAFVVIPTLFESISIPIYEAFRLGVPVCASRVVALPEQIGDAGVLFDPLSIDDMSTKMAVLLGDERLRRDLATRGLARIAGLTSEWYASRLADVLDRLTGNRHAAEAR
jgi:glycosyltransferase involved in cell wall biosynthesis